MGLILCLVAMTPFETMLYWPSPTNWWPHRVLCALGTRRPIVKVAMGCCTEPADVHIAHVLQKLHAFQFFNLFYNLQDLPQRKNYSIGHFFLYTTYIFHNLCLKTKVLAKKYNLCQKRKFTRFTPKK